MQKRVALHDEKYQEPVVFARSMRKNDWTRADAVRLRLLLLLPLLLPPPLLLQPPLLLRY